VRVDRYSQITVRTNRYSVPVRLIGRRVRVMLHASELIVYDGQAEVAHHERLLASCDALLGAGGLDPDGGCWSTTGSWVRWTWPRSGWPAHKHGAPVPGRPDGRSST
jgi:hypothetical protein